MTAFFRSENAFRSDGFDLVAPVNQQSIALLSFVHQNSYEEALKLTYDIEKNSIDAAKEVAGPVAAGALVAACDLLISGY